MINLKKILFWSSAFSFILSFKTLLSFNDGDLVTIKDQNNRYLSMPTTANNNTKYSPVFVSGLTHPNRVFKIKKFGNEVAFLGTTNGLYSGNNAGMLNTATNWKYSAYFDMGKTTNPTKYNKFSLTHRGGNNYRITNMWGLDEKPSGNLLANHGGEYIFEIKKIIGDGDFVSIKNSAGKYMEILPDANSTGPNNQRGLKFNSTTLSKISQTFKVKFSGDYIGFIGSINGDYSTHGWSGCLDAYYNGENAYFYQNTNQSDWSVTNFRAFMLYPKGEGQFAIYSKQHSLFEKSENNEFIEAAKNLMQYDQLSGSEIFTIESIGFNNGDFVTIKDHTGKYLEITSVATGPSGQYGAKFVSTTVTKPAQRFKVKRNGDYIGFIGSVTGNYEKGDNMGMLDANQRYGTTGTQNYAYFLKNNDDVNAYRAFILYLNGAPNKFSIYSAYHQVFENSVPAFTGSSYNVLDEAAVNLSQISSLGNSAIFTIEKVSQPEAVDNLSNDVETLQSEIIELNAQIASLNGQIKTKDANIASLNGQIKTKDANIASLNGQIKTKDSTIKELQNQISTLQKQINNNQSDLSSEITRLNGIINAYRTNLNMLNASINNQSTGLKVILNAQNAKLQNLESQINSLKASISQSGKGSSNRRGGGSSRRSGGGSRSGRFV